jgi:aryl-alcohol dehydrogenase-like predicted oxidoreductase
MTLPLRPLGHSDILVSPVAMGCWPIAGMTSLQVNDADSLATLQAAVAAGVNFFDTAYCYGPRGESERLIRQALGHRRTEIVIATKGGVHWDDQLKRVGDARPERLKQECEESLQRLGTDHVDLLYLHGPDPKVPVTDSAGALKELVAAGKTRTVGASNCSLEQLKAFHAVCPLSAVQPHYNMLQREIEQDILPWCIAEGISLAVYWPLMKGLLSGGLARNHQFLPGDGRAKYPMFQGAEWEKNQDFVDVLRAIAQAEGRTVSQVVVNWTIHRPGITVALCGAKRPYQIEETAGAMGWTLSRETVDRIDQAIAARGQPASRAAL